MFWTKLGFSVLGIFAIIWFLAPVVINLVKENNVKSDREIDGLKGDVVFVLEDANSGQHKVAIVYLDNGMEIRHIESMGSVTDNIFDEKTSYLDNKKSSRVSKMYKRGEEKTLSNTIYKYDSRGNIVSENDLDGNIYKIEYDNHWNKINESYINKEYTIKTHYYYSDSNLDSVIENYTFPKEHNKSQSVSYYKNDLLIESKEYDFKNDSVRIDKYVYDDKKDVLSKNSGNYSLRDNVLGSHFNVLDDYTYDDKGNWIVKRERRGGNVEVTSRTIIYKGGDYSSYVNQFEVAIVNLLNSVKGEKDLNSSVSGNLNSSPTLYSSNNSNSHNQNSTNQTKNQCSYCRGTGKCPTCNRTFRVHFWNENLKNWDDRNETRPGYVMCSDCHGSGKIYGTVNATTGEIESKPCYVLGCHNGWLYCQDCNYSGEGTNLGVCSHCHGTGYQN